MAMNSCSVMLAGPSEVCRPLRWQEINCSMFAPVTRRWTFDVQCSMFTPALDVGRSMFHVRCSLRHSTLDVRCSMFNVHFRTRRRMFDVPCSMFTPALDVGRSMFDVQCSLRHSTSDVRCSMFDVRSRTRRWQVCHCFAPAAGNGTALIQSPKLASKTRSPASAARIVIANTVRPSVRLSFDSGISVLGTQPWQRSSRIR